MYIESIKAKLMMLDQIWYQWSILRINTLSFNKL